MKNIVTFEQSVKLKDIGFNEYTWRTYSYLSKNLLPKGDIKKAGVHKNSELCKHFASVPTVSEALQWIRDKYNLMCGISLDSQWREYRWWYEVDKDYIVPYVFSETSINGYDDYPEAESELLNELLNYLEKIK